MKIAIVGAGLVGSLWAVFLAKKGYQVEVFERRGDIRQAGFAGGRSINLAMSHRGWHAIEKAGIRAEIEKVAIAMPGRMMHSVKGDLSFQPYGKQGQAIYSVSRGGLNLELLKIAASFPNVRFHFEHRCRKVDLEANTLAFDDLASGNIVEITADLIFGTDGAYSAIRNSLQKTDRFNYRQEYLEHGYKELTIPSDEHGKFRLSPDALHIWPRGNFMMIALPNADGSFTCTLFLPFEGDISFDKIKNDADALDFFTRYFPDTVPMMPTLLQDFWANKTSSLVTVQCRPWNYGNKVLVIGDSAHAIVPFFGQGMNAGFEDCTILDEMHDQFGGDWDKIIPAFAAARVKDADAIAELALRNFIEMRDKVGDPKFLLRKKIAAHLHEKFPDFLPVYSMVSFSNTPYSIALQEDDKQNALFEKILKIKNIEEKWNSKEVENQLRIANYDRDKNLIPN